MKTKEIVDIIIANKEALKVWRDSYASKTNINSSNGQLDFLQGIHSDAKNMWLEEFDQIVEDLFKEPLSEKRRTMIEGLALGIKGIGPETVNQFFALIELYYPFGLDHYRSGAPIIIQDYK